jgi:hypothetical protein
MRWRFEQEFQIALGQDDEFRESLRAAKAVRFAREFDSNVRIKFLPPVVDCQGSFA